ncbi:Rap1-interacting factor 1 N terminal-domain-containing protein [Lobosporangium transversale]|uniref:Rap1-interacting factor 1 N terminal-domain-containing protein n=1 Tax=Lobosporangium transversale TaxID=64571 RepID=A0A1Y2GU04_9FUNG|nr:Rap1-interacting factor 1 N terminal-domain-containing protein [Lobosporangium transversale]ORZ21746.1 Rap1-interacting factor 1 N terminal-domain-containing protein [Lobosporangium transversale]|eukprot:XP_021882997.1 Rap1-interacting factor 1 N terminal-domain-containing protein [Lobosporangium transversale]
MAIPKLIEKEYAKRIQAAKAFMKDFGTEFLEILAERFLNDNNEVYAITVWGALVTLLGKDLRKSSALSSMLKMAEKCFNSTSPTKTNIKVAAFQAWTRLIYSFAIDGHIRDEKILKLILVPLTDCFLNEKNNRVRVTCASSWVSLIYALGSKLPKHANQALFPQLRLAIEDDSENIRDLALKLIVALISNSGGQCMVLTFAIVIFKLQKNYLFR